MTSCPQQIAVPFAVCSFGGFGDIAFTSRTSKLDDSLQHRNILYNVKQFNVQLERLIFCKAIRRNATPFVCTLYHSTLRWTISHNAAILFVRCTILHYAEPFHATLHRLCVRCAIRHYPEPFHATLHRLCARCAIRHCAKPFHATLNLMCVHGTIRHYAEPFYATLNRFCTVLKMSAKLFAIELVHFTISCANST